MGYLVMTSGRVLLPQEKERAALPALRAEVGSHSGSLAADAPVSTLEDVARLAGARAVRDGDWVLLATDKTGDPTWSDRATAFYAALAWWVTEGEVRLTGEDGARWSYRYCPTGVAQEGLNGWDGSPAPAADPPEDGTPEADAPDVEVPAEVPFEPPVEPPVEPPSGQASTFQVPTEQTTPEWPSPRDPSQTTPSDPFWSSEAPAPRSSGRTFGMAVLLVAGVLCIVMVAMLAAGMVG